MYIQLNEEKIKIDFNNGIRVNVKGPGIYYFVEVLEYPKNHNVPHYLQGYTLLTKGELNFNFDVEFYMDFEVNVYKFIDKVGIKRIFTHRYNDYGKLVKFNLNTHNYNECLLWLDKINLYKEIHGCEVVIESKFDDINKRYMSYYSTGNLDYYKTYKIGRFPKTSTDYKSRETRKVGNLWFGNWKTFWSYQHPRFWGDLNSEEIVSDILGL